MILQEQISNCQKCELRQNCLDVKLGQKFGTSQIMLLLDQACPDEITIGEYFYGRTGQLLKKFLKETGLKDFYITSLVKCSGKPKKNEIETCSNWIPQEIKEHNIKVIVTFGLSSARYILSSKQTLKEILKEKRPQHRIFGDRIVAIYPWYSLNNISSYGKHIDERTKSLLQFIRKAYAS